jgi:hypothetical protein
MISPVSEYDNCSRGFRIPCHLPIFPFGLSQVFFSGNEFVVNVLPDQPLAPRALIWSPTHSGRSTGLSWCPENSEFLASFPPSCIPMLRSLKWRLFMRGDHMHVTLSREPEYDWVHTIDFIAQNVRPLSRLTMTFDTMFSRLDSGRGRNIGPWTVTRDEVMLPVRKLRGFEIYLSVFLREI